ncbi:helicase-associated domain-containing protein, partial [Kribbia dieselivorans]|uniref:helicase-associated domain-containing protein n=1 Tax=Kribbia dieselivorans TaxID=331526 RepID=UPI000A3FB971
IADDEEADPSWRPTAAVEEWLDADLAGRWATLLRTWLPSLRFAARVGQPLRTGAINALGAEVQWPPVRSLRLEVLQVLAALPTGVSIDVEGVVAQLRHARPRRMPKDPDTIVEGILRPAALLGVTARGALSGAGRALLAHGSMEVPVGTQDRDDLATELRGWLPEIVERVHVQADLTIIAPGPVVGRLDRFLRLVSDLESRGGATVHRLSEASVRRALDAGESAESVLAALAESATAALPQTVEYLVRDVARRHGRLRVGGAGSYLRSDDPGSLAGLLALRELSHLGLHQIAPTVVISPLDPSMVIPALREVGASPVRENAGGIVVRPGARRRAGRLTTPANHSAPIVSNVDDAVISATIESLRVGQARSDANLKAAAARQGPSIPASDPTQSLAVLREAAAEQRGVWVGHSNALGQVIRVLFYPRSIEGGRVRGSVDGVEQVLSVHRITGVAPE